MDSTTNAASNRVYQDFDPSTEWVREPLADILMVHLPGFRKDQLKVQVTSANYLIISGTRQLNNNTWSRFRKEIPIPSNYDTNGISAKFEKGILHLRNPKLIVPDSPAPPDLPKPTRKITNEDSSKPEAPKKPEETPKPTNQELPKPSKPLQEHSKPENQPKSEPSKPLETPKSQNSPEETPKPDKEEPSELDKVRTEMKKEEEVVRARKVTNKGAMSQEENAEKIEKYEALPGRNESGSSKLVMENYKDSIWGLMKEMKNARKATNILLIILFCAVLGLYIKNTVNFFAK